jgi:DNA repair protein RadC
LGQPLFVPDGFLAKKGEIPMTVLNHDTHRDFVISITRSMSNTINVHSTALTRRLVDALGLIDVRVIDHIVEGVEDTVSFAERGLI